MSRIRRICFLVLYYLIGIQRHQSSAIAFQTQLLPPAHSRTCLFLNQPPPLRRDDDVTSAFLQYDALSQEEGEEEGREKDSASGSDELDTVRVRIWRELANGKELSLIQLSNAVGERRLGELRSHLTHVEKQAKTIRNKSDEWRMRRGLPPVGNIAGAPSKMKLKFRKGNKNEILVRIV